MNFNQIFSEIEKVDPEVYDRLDSRRSAMSQFAKIGGKISLAALPFALGGMFNKAYGQTNKVSSIVDVLNFALTLEYLESEFYITGFGTPGLVTDHRSQIKTIRDHEAEHVALLIATITSLGGTPITKPKFDFTAGGTFPTVFSDYATFLAVAQTFEDTGVRAYKGQAGNLISDDGILTVALQIHSVEARHASHIRSMRHQFTGDDTILPWITGKDTGGIGSSVQASYDGEENTVQLGIEIVGINGFTITTDDATQCFDEPLTMDQVLAIVSGFIVG